MPREVESQSDHYAYSPHAVPEGPAVPDSYWHDDEAEEARRYHADEFGLDREPPPEHHLHDPGFSEHEVDPYPHM